MGLSCENGAVEDDADDIGKVGGVHETHLVASHFAKPASERLKLCKQFGQEYLLPCTVNVCVVDFTSSQIETRGSSGNLILLVCGLNGKLMVITAILN